MYQIATFILAVRTITKREHDFVTSSAIALASISLVLMPISLYVCVGALGQLLTRSRMSHDSPWQVTSRFSLSKNFTVRRHNSFHDRATSNQSLECLASQWISSCLSKELCICAAKYAIHLFPRETLHLEEEAIRTIRMVSMLQFVCRSDTTLILHLLLGIGCIRYTVTTIPTSRPLFSVSQDLHSHLVHRSIVIRNSYSQPSIQGSVG
jgi:hypothetical protein